MTVMYTFDNVIEFNKQEFKEKIKYFDIKIVYCSYSFNNVLKLVFNKIITCDQELELLDILY